MVATNYNVTKTTTVFTAEHDENDGHDTGINYRTDRRFSTIYIISSYQLRIWVINADENASKYIYNF
jgi:hypothetical protein